MRRGPWAKIFHDAWRHSKQNSLSQKAELAWYRMLSWCAESGTDGSFDRAQFGVVCGFRCGPRTLAELVKARLVEELDGGRYVMHDYLDHNITHADWRRKQGSEAAKKRRQRSSDCQNVPPGHLSEFQNVPPGHLQMSPRDIGRDICQKSDLSPRDAPSLLDPAPRVGATGGSYTRDSYSGEETIAYEHEREPLSTLDVLRSTRGPR
jgi:hypothetical protein